MLHRWISKGLCYRTREEQQWNSCSIRHLWVCSLYQSPSDIRLKVLCTVASSHKRSRAQTSSPPPSKPPSTCPTFSSPRSPFLPLAIPPKNDSDKEALQAFFGPDGAAHPPSNIGKLTKFAEALKADGVKNVGAYGFCWGAKICISSGGEDTPFSSVAMVHPAMLSADDAEKLTVPLAMYITKDESVDEV